MLALIAISIMATSTPAPQTPAWWELLEEQPGQWAWVIDRSSVKPRGAYTYARIYGLSAEPGVDATGDAYDYADMGVRIDCERRVWSETGGSLHTADGARTEDMPVTGEATAPVPVDASFLGATLFMAVCGDPGERRVIDSWSEKSDAFSAAFARIR